MTRPDPSSPPSCRICGGATTVLGTVHGDYSDRDYQLCRCGICGYAFIANPWTEFERIYDDRYYAGQGADPLVDYEFELSAPGETIRLYEWRGITRIVRELLGNDLRNVRWLDFGAGNGGLVRYVLGHTDATAVGYEEGSIAAHARAAGIPVESTLPSDGAGYDVVTAIEVLEHTLDPVAELQRIRGLLRPGGLLLLTTGNAAPFASRLTRWPYVIPEIHVSFFEPRTLERALEAAGFRPARMPSAGGFDEVLKFKVLKNLRVRRRSRLTDAIPSRPLAIMADARTRLRAHPIAWAT